MFWHFSPNLVIRISPSHFACDFPFPLEAGKVLLEAGRIDHPLGRTDERFVKDAVLVGFPEKITTLITGVRGHATEMAISIRERA